MIEVGPPKNNRYEQIRNKSIENMARFLHKVSCNDCVVKADESYPIQLQRCMSSKDINCVKCIKRYLDMELDK